jgi:hypothetical protein
VILGLLLAALAKVFARIGAKRRRALVDRRLSEAVGKVAEDHVLTPVSVVLERHRRTREALDAVAR